MLKPNLGAKVVTEVFTPTLFIWLLPWRLSIVWGFNPSPKQLGNSMNDEKMPEGLCRVGQIFWRVEVEDKDISPGLKKILEEMKREREV